MKNEALERLWRMLNIADIAGKGATPQQVSLWLQEVDNAIDEVGQDAYDEGYEDGYKDGHEAGYEVCVAEHGLT